MLTSHNSFKDNIPFVFIEVTGGDIYNLQFTESQGQYFGWNTEEIIFADIQCFQINISIILGTNLGEESSEG